MDISTRADIELLIEEFYEQLLVDEVVGFIFTDVAKIDLKSHLPLLVNFWEDQLFGTNNYSGNPMRKHMELHQLTALNSEYFDRWLRLFNRTVDSHFDGAKAHLAKERALSIATVMRIKITQL